MTEEELSMRNILDVIESVRESPTTYLDPPGISCLKSFLDTYEFTVDDSNDIAEHPYKPFDRFSAWVAARFDWYEHTAGWCNIILKETNNNV